MRKLFLVFVLFSNQLFAQINALGIGGDDPTMLVQEVLQGYGVSTSNASLVGSSEAVAYFHSNFSIFNMPFTSGILMTTGSKWLAQGPNNASGISYWGNLPSSYNFSPDLDDSRDVTGIEFDCVSLGDSLQFRYIFGSDEYPEYVDSKFDDRFLLYVSGPGINGMQNIARYQSSDIISINNINNGQNNTGPCMNCGVYVYNGEGVSSPYNLSSNYLQ